MKNWFTRHWGKTEKEWDEMKKEKEKEKEEQKRIKEQKEREEEERKRKKEREEEELEPLYDIPAKYIGGHGMYQHEKDIYVAFYEDEMILGLEPQLEIPYEKITRLGTQEDKHITKTRVVFTGPIIGLLWKKRFRYMVIEYQDEFMPQTVVMDFRRNGEEMGRWLYQTVQEMKTRGKLVGIDPEGERYYE